MLIPLRSLKDEDILPRESLIYVSSCCPKEGTGSVFGKEMMVKAHMLCLMNKGNLLKKTADRQIIERIEL